MRRKWWRGYGVRITLILPPRSGQLRIWDHPPSSVGLCICVQTNQANYWNLHIETYCQFFHLQTCMWLGIAPLMIDAKIMDPEFYLMWNIEDMEFKDCSPKISPMGASLSMNRKGACKARAWGRLCWNVCTLVLLLARNRLQQNVIHY